MTDFSAPEILHSNSMLPPHERKALGTFHDTEDGRKFVDEIFSDPQSPRLVHSSSNRSHYQSPIASPDHLNSVLSHESTEHPTVISTEGGEVHRHHQPFDETIKFDEGTVKFDENNPPSLQEHASTSHDEEGDDTTGGGPVNVPSTRSSEDETGSIVNDGQSHSSNSMHTPGHHHHHHNDRRLVDLNSMAYPDPSYNDGSTSLTYEMAHRQQYDPRMLSAPQHHPQPPYQYPPSSSMQKRISVMTPITMCFNRMLGAGTF